MAKRIGRKRFLDERAGEAHAAQHMGRVIAERSQHGAINNQFLQVDIDPEEAMEITTAAHEISQAAAHLRDVLNGIRSAR
jgi:hypothetical protein